MGAPGQGVVQGVEEEGVVTVSTRDPTHARHVGQRGGGRWGGGKVDDSLAIGPKHYQHHHDGHQHHL